MGSFDRLLKQTCTISNASGTDDYGKATVGSGTAVDCRFERTSKNVFDHLKGQQTTLHGIVFVKATTAASIGDQIVYNSQNYKIIEISEPVGRRGLVHHKELGVQLWRA